MRGEIIVITDEHQEAGLAIARRLLEINQPKYVVAIGGESGAGKTAITYVVSRALKEKGVLAKIVNLDNYYRIPPLERNAWRMAHGMESVGVGEYDWDLIRKHIAAFRADERAEMPCVDLFTDQVDQLKTNFNGIQFLLLDGLYPLYADADLKIHLDIPYEESLRAQELRGKEKLNTFRMDVLQREHEAILQLRPQADLILTKTFELIEQ